MSFSCNQRPNRSIYMVALSETVFQGQTHTSLLVIVEIKHRKMTLCVTHKVFSVLLLKQIDTVGCFEVAEEFVCTTDKILYMFGKHEDSQGQTGKCKRSNEFKLGLSSSNKHIFCHFLLFHAEAWWKIYKTNIKK